MSARALVSPHDASGPAVEWTLADLISVFARRRAWIFAPLAVSCSLALLFWACATPRYRATTVIDVEKQFRGAFGLDNTTADAQANPVSDSFDENLTLQTQIGILRSDALALEVIRRTGLENTTDYFAPRPSHLPWLHKLFLRSKPLEPLSLPIDRAPNRRYVALKIFSKHIKIAPAAGTRLISISYSDPDPARAAAVAEALVQSLSDFSYQSRSSAAEQSATWLRSQLTGLKQQTDALDAQAAALDRDAGAFGDDDAHNVVLARLDALNAALSAAQSSRIVREAIWRAVQNGDPEALSGLAGSPGAGPGTQNSFALLQSLRAQEAVAQSQIAESGDRYGENWPALAEQRAGLATIQKSVQDEIHRLGDRAHSDYEVSLQSENSARDAFNQQKDLASRLTGNAVALRLARQEADESRTLYTTLLGRLQQAGVLEGLHSANITVVTPALVPPLSHPASPSLPLLAVVALSAGLLTGCSAAILREVTDEAIHSTSDLESLLDTTVFAALPAPEPAQPRIRQWLRRRLPAPHHLDFALEATAASDFAIPAAPSAYVEALHRLRANLLLAHSDHPPQIVVLVPATAKQTTTHARAAGSSARGYEEPEPSLALSLAAVLAQYGAPALYVNANLRAAPAAGAGPVAPGLSDLLTSDMPPIYDHPGTTPSLLSVISAGSRPPCPSELIASARMTALLARWRDEFCFVVIDSPNARFADALVLAQQADAVLLAVHAGKTTRDQVLPAFHALSRQVPDHAMLGVLMEDVSGGGPYAHA
ncbi:MAG TPA: exopolysaccharide transport family protein [Acidobacteriaceae bacterium]